MPQITFGLVAGVYVDRLDRKRIMIVSDLLRGALVLVFIPAALSGQLWLLYAIAFVQATIGTFFTPARNAFLPNIVAKEGLLAANSIAQTSRIIFNLLGTGAAGVLAGVFSTFTPAFAIDAATFFGSLVLISRIQAPAHVPRAEAYGTRVIFSQLLDGFRTIFNNRVLVGILVGMSVTMLAMGAVNVLLVPMIVNDLQVPETWFALAGIVGVRSVFVIGGATVCLAGLLSVLIFRGVLDSQLDVNTDAEPALSPAGFD